MFLCVYQYLKWCEVSFSIEASWNNYMKSVLDEDEMHLEYLRPLSCAHLFPWAAICGNASISIITSTPETVDMHLFADSKVSVLNRSHFIVELCDSSCMWRPGGWPSSWHAFGRGVMGWEILLSTTQFPQFWVSKICWWRLRFKTLGYWKAQSKVYITCCHL